MTSPYRIVTFEDAQGKHFPVKVCVLASPRMGVRMSAWIERYWKDPIPLDLNTTNDGRTQRSRVIKRAEEFLKEAVEEENCSLKEPLAVIDYKAFND